MKKQRGQFYTTNYSHILQGLLIPRRTKTVIEPFCGKGDLLALVPPSSKVELYDIEPKYPGTTQRDTLLDPPCYTGKYVLTNPPYLARNKNQDKTVFDRYEANDLFKCFLSELITNVADGGIVIVPVNFWSSIRKNDVNLRRKFLSVYSVSRVNIFEYPVFDDTDYSVCAFQFDKRMNTDTIEFHIFKADSTTQVISSDLDNEMCLIGGELYELPVSKSYKVNRLTRETRDPSSNLFVHCIDGKTTHIRMELVSDENRYIDDTKKLSARSFATLVIVPSISLEEQRALASEFNRFLEEKRIEFNSLFLANYREGSRKRISFALVYRIVGWLLSRNPETLPYLQ